MVRSALRFIRSTPGTKPLGRMDGRGAVNKQSPPRPQRSPHPCPPVREGRGQQRGACGVARAGGLPAGLSPDGVPGPLWASNSVVNSGLRPRSDRV